jgi:hypothetical protein
MADLLSIGTSTIAGAAAGPVGLVAGFLGSIVPSLGSKYTKDTFVQRFVAAQTSGDDTTAGKLIDQAVFHAYAGFYTGSTNVPYAAAADATTWKGLLAACYQQGSTKWRNYITLRLAGTPAQYDLIGTIVAQPESISGVMPNANPVTAPNPIGKAISDFLGLGQTANQAAATGGQAAGSAIGKGIVTAALIVAAVVVLIVLVRLARK